MELKKVRELLADYYEGKTSRDEDTRLMEFFMQNDVPSDMETDRLMFLSFDEASNEEVPDGQFDGKIIALINNQAQHQKDGTVKKLIYTISGIAAGFLLLAGSYFLLVEKKLENVVSVHHEYTIDETHLAYEEARNALLLVSRVMNTGTEQLEAISKISDAAGELKMINRFNQGIMELQTLSIFEETNQKITVNQ
jgi:bifunctional N-acetylglucosamine-1-phosphate-uridyltransferase/glucosamine-1-phosphate-acetyltransferase GlmU-like protein